MWAPAGGVVRMWLIVLRVRLRCVCWTVAWGCSARIVACLLLVPFGPVLSLFTLCDFCGVTPSGAPGVAHTYRHTHTFTTHTFIHSRYSSVRKAPAPCRPATLRQRSRRSAGGQTATAPYPPQPSRTQTRIHSSRPNTHHICGPARHGRHAGGTPSPPWRPDDKCTGSRYHHPNRTPKHRSNGHGGGGSHARPPLAPR